MPKRQAYNLQVVHMCHLKRKPNLKIGTKLRKTPTQIKQASVKGRRPVSLCSRSYQLLTFQLIEASALTSQHVTARRRVTILSCFRTFSHVISCSFFLLLSGDYSILREQTALSVIARVLFPVGLLFPKHCTCRAKVIVDYPYADLCYIAPPLHL